MALHIIHRDTFAGSLVAFSRVLKENGLMVSIPSVMDALSGASRVGLEDSRDLRTALKAVFTTRVEEAPAFDRLFDEFWLRIPDDDSDPLSAIEPEPDGTDDPDGPPSDQKELVAETSEEDAPEPDASQADPLAMYSPREILWEKDFKDIPDLDDARMTRLIREIVAPIMRRVSWRKRQSATGLTIDFRRLLRRNVRYGGEVYEIPRLKPRFRIKKLVFLCDVSGSMNPYLRFILQFINELQSLPTKVETFVFATRLNRVTPILRNHAFPRAVREIAHTAKDWSGGTRIGQCLKQLTSEHGDAMLRPSSVVLIHSDGWDRGDPDLLDYTMSRIHSRVYRLLWINPLLGGAGYEPTCKGMKTALPYVDSFLPGHSIAGLERVAGTLRGIL